MAAHSPPEGCIRHLFVKEQNNETSDRCGSCLVTVGRNRRQRRPHPPVKSDSRDHPYRPRDKANGPAIAAGIGFLALTAILASQANHDHDGWYRHDGYWHDRDYGYRNYDRGYGYSQPYGGYRGWEKYQSAVKQTAPGFPPPRAVCLFSRQN